MPPRPPCADHAEKEEVLAAGRAAARDRGADLPQITRRDLEAALLLDLLGGRLRVRLAGLVAEAGAELKGEAWRCVQLGFVGVGWLNLLKARRGVHQLKRERRAQRPLVLTPPPYETHTHTATAAALSSPASLPGAGRPASAASRRRAA